MLVLVLVLGVRRLAESLQNERLRTGSKGFPSRETERIGEPEYEHEHEYEQPAIPEWGS